MQVNKKKRRTLYECAHARVGTGRIYCNQKYPLSQASLDGSLDVHRLEEGKQLAPKVCQQCDDFDCMGPPVPEEERGWLNMKEVKEHGSTDRQALREAVA
ncbi:hypothetical protein [Dehalococcoides mccartyi]|uniref:hypothetical protein n=1 Tax=Dehalococcoides mccartyi TaxID=61435 RepID=UPI0002B76469|nr:hypothetical protein [Dehalococcoides mccartyi]AGG05905.1 hypothetical protein dcmb_274 [Dehalococcoides mccartyi DCMB5]